MKNTLKSLVLAGLVGLVGVGCNDKPVSLSVQSVKVDLESLGPILLYDIDSDNKVDGIKNADTNSLDRFYFVAKGYKTKIKPFGQVISGETKTMSDHMKMNVDELYRSINAVNNSVKLDKDNKIYIERH